MSNINNSLDYETRIQNQEPIDAKDPAYEQILKDLQGGIIKNYGQNYSLYLFIQFDQNKVNEVKQWIREEMASSITSIWKQLEDTRTYQERRGFEFSAYAGELCKNFFLSVHGYKVLGFNEQELKNKMDPNFYSGMVKEWECTYRLQEQPLQAYWYNPPEQWDIGKDRIDAMISLAHDDLEEIKKEANAIIGNCEKLGKVLGCEAGYILRKNPTDKTEPFVGPFGFLDGISQPLFLKSDYDRYRKTEDIDKWDPRASLNLVLVKDPFGEAYSFGSYCVETNYELFEKKVDELAEVLECDRERASALVIGRFKDGTPLDLSNQPNQNAKSSNRNNFDYADDYDGARCPVQAHIRKVNPCKDDKLQAEFR